MAKKTDLARVSEAAARRRRAREAEEGAPGAPAPLDVLRRWLRERGVDWDESAVRLVEEGDVGGGRGVRAARALRAGETLARIPKAAVLSRTTTAVAGALLEAVRERAVDFLGRGGGRCPRACCSGGGGERAENCARQRQQEDEEQEEEEEGREEEDADLERKAADLVLAVALMAERGLGERSAFYGYLRCLPLQEPLPHTWDVELRNELLRGTEIDAETVDARRDDLALIFERVVSPALRGSSVRADEAAFVAAHTIVESRAFFVDARHGVALVPLADMFNHMVADMDALRGDPAFREAGIAIEGVEGADAPPCSAPPVLRRNRYRTARRPAALLCHTGEDCDAMSMRLFSDVREGAEICNTYGEMNNAGLLLTRGFCMREGTPFEIVNVSLAELIRLGFEERGREGPVRAEPRVDFLSQFDGFGAFFTLSPDDPLPSMLVVAARVLLMDGAAFEAMASAGAEPDLSPELSHDEHRVISSLLERRARELDHTTQGVDRKEMALAPARGAADALEQHLRAQAARLRFGERELLSDCRRHLDEVYRKGRRKRKAHSL